MKKFWLFLILALLIATVFSITVSAEEAADPYSGTCGASVTWTFEPETGALSIEGSGAMQNFYKQYSQYAPWYSFRTDVKSVTVGEGITTIGFYAFYSCENLESVKLPSTLKSIVGAAFCYCSSLKEIVIPEGVTLIESDAFTMCTSLERVILPNTLERLEYCAFYGCAIKEITLPESLTAMEFWTFYECKELKRFNIPKNVTEIGNNILGSSVEEVLVSSPYYAELLRSGSDNTAIARYAKTIYLDASLGEIESSLLSRFTYRYTVEIDDVSYYAYSVSAHTHTYDQTDRDAEYLAKEASCSNQETYYYSCICGAMGVDTFEYGGILPHTHSETLTYGADTHWYPCTVCGDRKDEVLHSYSTPCDKICNECPYERATGHSLALEWQTDENGHWMVCYNCTERLYEATHTASGDYLSDATEHWSVCSVCEARTTASSHSDENRDGKCDICSIQMSEAFEEDSESLPPMTEVTEPLETSAESSGAEDVTSEALDPDSSECTDDSAADAGCGGVVSSVAAVFAVGVVLSAALVVKKKDETV